MDNSGPNSPLGSAAQASDQSWQLPIPVVTGIVVAIIGIVAITLAEYWQFGWHPAREEQPSADFYHVARSAAVVFFGTLIAVALGRSTQRPAPFVPLRLIDSAGATAAMTAALLMTGLLIVSPALFGMLAQEDHILEWSSALLLFLASGMFLADALKRARNPLGHGWQRWSGPILSLAFAGLFFLIAMEEISWMQRVIGFSTPEALANSNWQGEFNLHNMQTDLSELAFYTGTGFFLLILPLFRELQFGWKPVALLGDHVPGRAVAAISAPIAVFDYGHWNLLPIQLVTAFAIFSMMTFGALARRTGRNVECILFFGLAAAIFAGQSLVLAAGHQMSEIWEATEFKEFFIALGLSWFAFQVRRTVPTA
jgi:hypothetical protein